MSTQAPDAYLVQVVAKGDKVWEHRWYVPRWGDPDPSALHDTTYTIRGREHPELGTYRVTPFYAAPPAQGIDLGAVAALIRQARVYLQGGLNSQCMNKLDDVQTLIDQRDAAPGVGA